MPSEAADAAESAELVVFAHGFVDLPRARHARRKGDQIAFAKTHWLSAFRRYRDIAFQQVASFLLVIVSRKLRHFLLPNGPGHRIEFIEATGGWVVFDSYWLHGSAFTVYFPVPLLMPPTGRNSAVTTSRISTARTITSAEFRNDGRGRKSFQITSAENIKETNSQPAPVGAKTTRVKNGSPICISTNILRNFGIHAKHHRPKRVNEPARMYDDTRTLIQFVSFDRYRSCSGLEEILAAF